VSGAHLNPVVTLADRLLGQTTSRAAAAYCAAQVCGAGVGVLAANVMFSLPAVELSAKVRSGTGLWLAELIATFGLVLLIFSLVRTGRTATAPFAVGAWIAGAYWFTASTSFANPAVALARELSNTFAGIAPSSVPAFVLAQLIGRLSRLPRCRPCSRAPADPDRSESPTQLKFAARFSSAEDRQAVPQYPVLGTMRFTATLGAIAASSSVSQEPGPSRSG
jgi:hypothetical protein